MATTGYQAALDSNDLIMSYVPEATWGVSPTASPAFKKIRLDSEGFSGSKTRTRPNEIDPSGQSSAAITTKEESTGSLNFSVSAGTHNDLLAASLGGVWTGNSATAASVAGATGLTPASATIGTAAATSCVLTCTGTTFATPGDNLLIKGQWIKLHSTTGSQQGVARIAAVTSDTVLSLDCCSWTPANGALTAPNIKGSCLRNGTTFQSFTFLKQLSALLNLRYAGAFPTGGSLDVGVGDYLKGTMAFINKAEVSATDMAFFTTPTFAAAPTGTIIDSVKGIGTVWRGVDTGTTAGAVAAIQGIVQKIGVKWNKEGAAGQYGIGSTSAAGMRSGKQLVNGTLSTYFKDFSLYTQYTAEQAGPISFSALDGIATVGGSVTAAMALAVKGYVITFCNATIMNPKVVAGGPGQDIMADFEIEGNPDVTGMYAGKTIQIDYFA